jgi:phage-related protein (TIGR01555 family)
MAVGEFRRLSRAMREDIVWGGAVQRRAKTPRGVAMDSSMSSAFTGSNALSSISDQQLEWFAGQRFIGHQACAILMQHWLIDRAVTMPARDAVRVGWKVTVNDGTKLSPDVLTRLQQFDKKRHIRRQLVEFGRMGRCFGIRVALFEVESDDPLYYQKPFNPDGVRPGSYKGISQVDPYWMVPILSARASSNPWARDFYVPTWWQINGKKYHHTHLVIMRTSEPTDLLKPTYLYGGIPVPQAIIERVYAADRIANEGPALALSKRSTVLHTDVDQVIGDQAAFEERLASWVYFRDNFGIKVAGTGETVEQFETSLADLDDVIMVNFQLVAAAAGVPATKLLGTTPKGFNSSGDYEEASYHEELESIQEHDLTPLLERHYTLAIRSEIAPDAPFEVDVVWNKLDALTAKEQADVNKVKADTDAVLVNCGALDGQDVRSRVVADEDSGYTGISDEVPDEVPDDAEVSTEGAPGMDEMDGDDQPRDERGRFEGIGGHVGFVAGGAAGGYATRSLKGAAVGAEVGHAAGSAVGRHIDKRAAAKKGDDDA